MRYYIQRGTEEIWLSAASPRVKWGPRSQARPYATRGEAVRAISRLKISDRNRLKLQIVAAD